MKASSIIICMLCMLVSGLAQAATKTVTLTAVKDCVVKKTAPDTAFPSDPNLTAYKANGSDQTFFLWEFTLPVDCLAQNIDPATFKFKTVLVKKQMTANRAAYINIIKDAADIATGDLNALTFNTAPGVLKNLDPPGTTNNIDAATAAYVGYGTPVAVDGAEWVYVPTGAYLTSLATHLAADTNQRLIFLFHPRYLDTVGDLWASVENQQYHGPQIEFTYQPIQLPKELTVSYSGEVAKEEGNVPITYTVALKGMPSSDVTVNIEYNTQRVTVNPTSLTFTTANYDVPQTVTVTPIDDDIARDIISTTNVRNIPTSSDEGYQFAPIVSIAVAIEDNDYKTALLTAIADTDVKSVSPNSNFSSATELAPMKASDPTDYVYTYMQFELPSDFVYALGSTKFKLTRTYVSPTSNFLYLIGVRGKKLASGEIIPEGNVNTYTWNTAPALDIVPNTGNVNTATGFDTDMAVFIANAAGAPSATVGSQMYMTTGTSTEPLRNFINANHGGDGKITLFIVTRILQTDVDRFASIENGTYSGPQIELVYGNTPYCGQPGQAILAGDFNEDCSVDTTDLSGVIAKWLNTTD